MEQENFKNYLLRKLVDFENQQLELRRRLLDIGETRLAGQAEIDSSRLRHLVLPFLDDKRCTSRIGFSKLWDEHMDGLPERYLRVREMSLGYAFQLYTDCRFVIRRLFNLGVLDSGAWQRFDKRLDQMISQSLGADTRDIEL